MDEIRKKDVLRLFFGKEHKHYLVLKVGKQTIKLKTEQGLDLSLPHKEGKLETLGDATITGFEVLRDPNRYNQYVIGAEVAVRTHDGKSFKGDVLENADGLLKIKTDSGNEWYVDLDANDKVELIGNSVMDEADEVKLPDEIEDLFFLNVQKESKTKFNRVYEAYRMHADDPPIPFWVVPILDQDKCKINISKTDELNEAGLDHFLRTTAGKPRKEKVEAVLFNQTVFGDRVKATYVYAAATDEKLPVAEYALMIPITTHAKCNFLNPHLGERLTHPTSDTKRFDTLKDAVAAFVPNIASSNSAFEAQLQLYPLPLTPQQLERIVVSKRTKNKKNEVTPPKQILKKSRSSLAKAYEGRITDGLTPSETLARIFALDYGISYFSKSPAFRIPHEKGWVLETLGQRVKASPNPTSAYAKEAIAIINEVYALFCEARYTDVLRLIQEYGRVATPDENSDYLYFSTPVFSKYKLVSCTAEHVARMGHFRGKTGLDTALHHFVAEDGLLLDRSTGLVYSPLEQPKIVDANDCAESEDVACFLQTVPTYSEEDLIVLNLAQRLARELNLRISPENEVKLLDAVRLEGKDTYRSACTVAAFLAHYGKVNIGVAAGALRKVAKKKMWAPVQESKELTADVTKAAAKLIVPNKDKDKNKEKEKQNVGNVNSKPPPVVPTFERITPSDESKLRGASETSWTVLATVQPKEYAYLADVFAPDLAPAAVLARCMPVVMETVAPSEKSFFTHLGEGSLRGLYEFVLNLTCVVPTLVITGRRGFDQHVLPANHVKKKNSSYIANTVSFVVDYTTYYSGVLAMDISKASNDVASRFALVYKQKAPTFQRLVAVAKTALFKKDEEMMQACAVRAGYLHLSDDMSDEMQAYIAQMIRACVEMYRKTIAK